MGTQISLQKRFLSVLESFEREPVLRSLQGFAEDIGRWKHRLQDEVFRIAVVGEFSSGKSTFINALLGKDVLSHASRETTAVLTQIINVPAKDARVGTGIVRRKDGTQQKIRVEELKEYTTTMSERHAVAQEIASVDIYTPLLHARRPLMLIDTPGLNGIASGHLDQTMRVVQEAHACIYLLQQRGLTKEDLAFLRNYLLPNQQNFIFVQNFIDAFNPVEGESVEQRLPLLEKVLREEVFKESKEHVFYLCGVSALKELAGQDRGIKRLYEDSREELDEAERQKLRQESNFADFRKLLEEKFDERHLEELQYSGTANAILHWTDALLQRILRRAEDARAVYEVSKERRAVEKLTRLQNMLIDAKDDHLSALHGFIRRKTDDAAKEVRKVLLECGEQAENEIKMQIADCSTIEEIEEEKRELPVVIARHLNGVQQTILKDAQASMSLLYQMIAERIEEYSGIAGKVVRVQQPLAHSLPETQEMPVVRSAAVEMWQERIAQRCTEKEELQGQLVEIQEELAHEQKIVEDLDKDADGVRCKRDDLRKAVRDMGSRPEERTWTEEVEIKRDGIIGFFADIFFPKTEIRTRYDDSAGEAWDAERRKLQIQQNDHAARYDDIQQKKMAKERLLRRYQADKEANEERIKRCKEALEDYAEILKAEKEKEAMQQKHAAQAYLNQCKKQLSSWVRRYLYGEDGDGGEVERLLAAWKQNLETGRQKLEHRAHDLYDEAMQQRLAQLEQAKREKSPELMRDVQDLTRAQDLLTQSIHQMKEALS